MHRTAPMDQYMTLQDPSLPTTVLSNLFRDEGSKNVHIHTIDGTIVRAHDAVLAAVSPRLKNSLSVQPHPPYRITTETVSERTWDVLLKLCYLGAAALPAGFDLPRFYATVKGLDIRPLVHLLEMQVLGEGVQSTAVARVPTVNLKVEESEDDVVINLSDTDDEMKRQTDVSVVQPHIIGGMESQVVEEQVEEEEIEVDSDHDNIENSQHDAVVVVQNVVEDNENSGENGAVQIDSENPDGEKLVDSSNSAKIDVGSVNSGKTVTEKGVDKSGNNRRRVLKRRKAKDKIERNNARQKRNISKKNYQECEDFDKFSSSDDDGDGDGDHDKRNETTVKKDTNPGKKKTNHGKKDTNSSKTKNNNGKKDTHPGKKKNDSGKQKANNSNEFTCDFCERSFHSGHALSLHRVRSHGLKYTKTKSPKCVRKSPTKLDLMTKIKLYKRKCAESAMKKLVNDKNNTETNKKSETCKYCEKKFASAGFLKYHIGNKCTVKKSMDLEKVRKKRSSCHSKTNEKRIYLKDAIKRKCSECEYVSKTVAGVGRHQRDVHGIDKCFKCKLCQKAVSGYMAFRNHVTHRHIMNCPERKRRVTPSTCSKTQDLEDKRVPKIKEDEYKEKERSDTDGEEKEIDSTLEPKFTEKMEDAIAKEEISERDDVQMHSSDEQEQADKNKNEEEHEMCDQDIFDTAEEEDKRNNEGNSDDQVDLLEYEEYDTEDSLEEVNIFQDDEDDVDEEEEQEESDLDDYFKYE